ncbi:hypothetical protein BHE74_00053477 [Ensete ventricosum]|nr:hypothetical protein BHE74_00053477 [Ensete ventricosum]
MGNSSSSVSSQYRKRGTGKEKSPYGPTPVCRRHGFVCRCPLEFGPMIPPVVTSRIAFARWDGARNSRPLWSLIARRLPGRTDNEIKNHWNTHLCKRSLTIDDLNLKLNQNVDSAPPLASSHHDLTTGSDAMEEWILDGTTTHDNHEPLRLLSPELHLLDLEDSVPTLNGVGNTSDEFGVEAYGGDGNGSLDGVMGGISGTKSSDAQAVFDEPDRWLIGCEDLALYFLD